jgi:diguanylate cyclase (GGDEF)-like protein
VTAPAHRGDEAARLAALRRLEVLDTAPEESFEKIVALVRTVLDVPIATVTLVDADRQWFKARSGLTVSETPRCVSFCTYTIEQAEPLVIPDTRLDSRVAESPLVTGEPFLRAYAGAPLTTPDGYNVGTLCAMDTEPRAFSAAEVGILANFASLVVDELELRQIARRDALTGALSRRGFLEAVDKEIARCRRLRTPAALVILDLDHFKRINDGWGHPAGDAVLRDLASLADAALRGSDSFGRLGGEEFALLLPAAGGAEARQVAERLRTAIAAHHFTLAGGERLPVTASLGVAAFEPALAGAEAWIAAADVALYAAKRGGRNRVELAATRDAAAA